MVYSTSCCRWAISLSLVLFTLAIPASAHGYASPSLSKYVDRFRQSSRISYEQNASPTRSHRAYSLTSDQNGQQQRCTLIHSRKRLSVAAQVSPSQHIDQQALLAFKAGVSRDPYGLLALWNTSAANACNWTGVLCDRGSPRRVVALNLSGGALQGSIAPGIGNLNMLEKLALGNNSLNARPIPPEIGKLQRLYYLDLSFNNLSGSIPGTLGSLGSLTKLALDNNLLMGTIPTALGNCSLLQGFTATINNLTGRIPAELGSLATLVTLDLLSGFVPDLASPSLMTIELSFNFLTGLIPASLANNSNLMTQI